MADKPANHSRKRVGSGKDKVVEGKAAPVQQTIGFKRKGADDAGPTESPARPAAVAGPAAKSPTGQAAKRTKQQVCAAAPQAHPTI